MNMSTQLFRPVSTQPNKTSHEKKKKHEIWPYTLYENIDVEKCRSIQIDRCSLYLDILSIAEGIITTS